jgi:aminobenzoyl-glutamate transport protein
VYSAVGRSPLIGIAAVTAGVSMGFGSNVFLTTQDPMLSGLTEQAAQLLDKTYTVDPACNWYFKIASTIVLVLTGWLVTARWVEPAFLRRRGAPSVTPAPVVDGFAAPIAPRERSGLVLALGATLVLLALLLASALTPGGFLHDAPPAAGAAAATPTWIASIVALLVLLFLVPGLVYGIRVGTIRSSRDVARMMGEYLGQLGGYVVMAFFAAILVAAFERSNLGVMLAIAGGNELRALDLPRWTLFLALILLSSSIDLVVVSMSAKWALLATVVVPMFMTLGISPELTQATYRIGDSITNPISPLNPYLYVVLAIMRRHEPSCGFGTMLALLLPYSVAFGVVWIALLMVWIAGGWPLGPDGPLVYPPG